MKILNSEKENNFKFAFANDFNEKNNYKYFKCIEKNKSIVNNTHPEINDRYTIILDNLRKKKNFNRTSNIVWICKHCGYVHIGVESPSACPICNQPASSFVLQASNY